MWISKRILGIVDVVGIRVRLVFACKVYACFMRTPSIPAMTELVSSPKEVLSVGEKMELANSAIQINKLAWKQTVKLFLSMDNMYREWVLIREEEVVYSYKVVV
ncbi:MAG: hypothetical protein AAGJ35_08735 [Myxococcota bacterium]